MIQQQGKGDIKVHEELVYKKRVSIKKMASASNHSTQFTKGSYLGIV